MLFVVYVCICACVCVCVYVCICFYVLCVYVCVRGCEATDHVLLFDVVPWKLTDANGNAGEAEIYL